MGSLRIITASAGSGKTWRLAQLLEQAVASGRARPDAVLATTFTRTAAAELQSRVRARLLASGRAADAERLEGARIGTVNAICGDLVTQHAFSLGLSPALTVWDEETSRRGMRAAVASVVTDDEQFVLDGLGSRMEQFDWNRAVYDVVSQARLQGLDSLERSARRSVEGLAELLDAPVTDDLDEALLRAASRALRDLDAIDDSTGLTRDAKSALQQALGIMRRGGDLSWGGWLKLQNLKTAKAAQALVSEVQQAAARLDAHPRLHADLALAIERVFALAARAETVYRERKRAAAALDFVDAEACALRLLGDETVRGELRESLDLVLVDEFQDTSPLQLAIFLALADLAPESVWVGDPKQAIYGFRGTDPRLMQAALEVPAEVETLRRSYRSRPSLVRLTNRLFSGAFERLGMDEAVALEAARGEDDLGCPCEVWVLRGGRSAADDAARLAHMVAALLRRGETVRDGDLRPMRPRDVAILCRQNDGCERVAAALTEVGVAATLRQAGLMATPEAILVEAGLRVQVDPEDSLARAEIARWLAGDDARFVAALLGRGPGATGDLAAAEGRGDGSAGAEGRGDGVPVAEGLGSGVPGGGLGSGVPGAEGRGSGVQGAEALRSGLPGPEGLRSGVPGAEGRDDSAAASLAEVDALLASLRRSPADGVLDVVDDVMETLRVRERCLAWDGAAQRLANLEALRAHCVTFVERATVEREAVTVVGLLAFLRQLADDRLDRQGVVAADAVTVSTWHAAKGLEWPVTVLFDLDPPRPPQVLGRVHAVSDAFDLRRPLDGRWLRYWPDPFRDRQRGGQLHARLETHAVSVELREAEAREALRLLYVGWTRARDRVVLAGRPGFLSRGLLAPLELDECALLARGDVLVRECDAEVAVPALGRVVRALTDEPLAGVVARGPRVYAPAFVQPSSLQARAELGESQHIGESLRLASDADMTAVGEAVHGFLAADRPELTEVERFELAAGLISRWKLGTALAPRSLLRSGDALRAWVERRWPGAVWRREWPLQMRLASGQRMRGMCDLVLEVRDGLVIVDHKCFSRRASEGEVEGAAGQLSAYAAALRAATGRRVAGMFVHLPVGGDVVEVREIDVSVQV